MPPFSMFLSMHTSNELVASCSCRSSSCEKTQVGNEEWSARWHLSDLVSHAILMRSLWREDKELVWTPSRLTLVFSSWTSGCTNNP